MKNLNKLFLVTIFSWINILFLFPVNLFAAPSITSTSGVMNHGEIMTISGSSFGVKSPAKPYLWAPFEGSSAPSDLGIMTAWTSINNMAYAPNEGVGGTGGLMATNSAGNWTARINASGFSWSDDNQKMYLFRKVKRNFILDETINWKIFRLWPAGFGYPNLYFSTTVGRLAVEGGGGGTWFGGAGSRGPINEWRTDEVIMRAESGFEQSDGYLQYIANGSIRTTASNLLLRTTAYPAYMVMNFVVHGVKANHTFEPEARYWADDVYLDTTWARVMLGNAPTLEQSTHREPLIPSAWSGTSITVTINTGTFTAGQAAYLYVVDADGNVNENGYPVVIGETNTASSPPPSPPSILWIN